MPRVTLLTITFLILTNITSLTLADSSSGPCVSACPLLSSFCNGDETGKALDDCLCQTFLNGASLINCVKACPPAEISAFAANVPSECRSSLFPGVSVSSSATGASSPASTGSAAATTTESKTAESTASPTAAGTETLGTSSGAASPTKPASGSMGTRNAVAGLAVLAGGMLAAFAL